MHRRRKVPRRCSARSEEHTSELQSLMIYPYCHTLSLHDALPISGAQAAAVPAIRHAVNDGGGGAARRVLAVLSGLDLDPGDTTVVASGPADVAGDVDGVIAGGRNRLPAPTIPCIDAGRSHGDAARPALHAGDTGPVAGRCR